MYYEEVLKQTIQIRQTPWEQFPQSAKFQLLSLNSSFFSLVYPLFSLTKWDNGGIPKSYCQHYADTGNISILALIRKLTREPGLEQLLPQAIKHCQCNSKYDFPSDLMQLGFSNMDVLTTPRSIIQAFYYSFVYGLKIPGKVEISFYGMVYDTYYHREIKLVVSLPDSRSYSTIAKVIIQSLETKEEHAVIMTLMKIFGEKELQELLIYTVKKIIEADYDNTKFRRELSYKSKRKHVKRVLEIMKKYNVDTKKTKWNEMMNKAAERGHAGGMCALAKAGIDINRRDRKGYTPLFRYVLSERCSASGIVRLVRAGADVNAITNGYKPKTVYDVAYSLKSRRRQETLLILKTLQQLMASLVQ